MKVIITGATGMVGEGVLMECMQNHAVQEILMVNRKPSPLQHRKLKELLVPDFTKLEAYADALTGYNACFYCAGVSSVGMNEEKYTYITYDTTISFAKQLAAWNPDMVFTFVTGAGTDSTEKGKIMWARVKGRTENALMRLPFKGVYNFRPGFMKPFKGQQNIKTLFKILIPVVSLFISKSALTLQQVAQAMINAVQKGYTKHVLEIADIKDLSSK
jgi:uncharacterized protein YbjT (DUF2867 family)